MKNLARIVLFFGLVSSFASYSYDPYLLDLEVDSYAGTEEGSYPNFDYGLAAITRKVNDESSEIEGVLFVDYFGYNVDLEDMDHSDLKILPTGLTVSVDGKEVKVFTDIITWELSIKDGYDFALEGISYEFNKNNSLQMREDEVLAYVNAKLSKTVKINFANNIDLDIEGSIGALGKINRKSVVEAQEYNVQDDLKYTYRLLVGSKLTVIESVKNIGSIEIYPFIGIEGSEGDISSSQSIYAGVEIYGLSYKDYELRPRIEYVSQSSGLADIFEATDAKTLISLEVFNK
ncbi:MAG: hypothetical protein HON90_08900 [Halobacteriovoraceae bacterium]|jgi:hypothetical protein|nr:hypothetical protein [Halobacteriovoraceae bacterium]